MIDNGNGNRKANGKGGPAMLPRALHFNFTAMSFNQMSYDRQSQPESTLRPSSRTIGLSETIENVRQKLLAEADPVIGDPDSYLRVFPFGGDCDLSAFRCELDRVSKKIPEDLLQPVGVSQQAEIGFHDSFQFDLPGR